MKLSQYLRWIFPVILWFVGLTSVSHASIIYDWTGSGLPGGESYFGVLTLDDSFDGSKSSFNSSYISWQWRSPFATYDYNKLDILSVELLDFGGTVNTPTFISFVLDVDAVNQVDHYENSNSWAETYFDGQSVRTKNGYNANWTKQVSVPEPSIIALMSLGFLSFAAFRRKDTDNLI